MNIKLQEILRNLDNWEVVLKNYPYCFKWDINENYVCFKYSQIDSDFSLQSVKEARGIIFDMRDWSCVAYPFSKFFNYGESHAAALDWDGGVQVQEKVDGSLMKIWNHNNKWHLSTNGQIDAFKTPTGNALYPTFGDLFNRVLEEYGFGSFDLDPFDEFCTELNKNYTYMFELATEYNRIVIPYTGFHLYYLGQRDMRTYEECNKRSFFASLIEVPKLYPMTQLHEVCLAAEKLPFSEEGYVVIDKNWNRCKIKSPAYVAAHYIRNNNVITPRHVIGIIQQGEIEEFKLYASDYADYIDNVKAQMEDLEQRAVKALAHLKTFEFNSRKEYALEVNKIKSSTIRGFCFSNFDKEISFKNFTNKWSPQKWEEILEIENNNKDTEYEN